MVEAFEILRWNKRFSSLQGNLVSVRSLEESIFVMMCVLSVCHDMVLHVQLASECPVPLIDRSVFSITMSCSADRQCNEISHTALRGLGSESPPHLPLRDEIWYIVLEW